MSQNNGDYRGRQDQGPILPPQYGPWPPQRPKRPGWVIPAVAAAAVCAALLLALGGRWAVRRLAPGPAPAAEAASAAAPESRPGESPREAEPTPTPAPAFDPDPEPDVLPERAEGEWPLQEQMTYILDSIEGDPEFCRDGACGPIGSLTNIDADETLEFLAVYECGAGDEKRYFCYELWALKETEDPVQVRKNKFCLKTGGNKGTVGWKRMDGQLYLEVYISSPDGEQMNETHIFSPWTGDGFGGRDVLLQGVYPWDAPEKGEYSTGGRQMAREDFDAQIAGFEDAAAPLDLLAGPDGEHVLSFDRLRP